MSPRKRSAARATSGQLVCPECGKTFTRPASLGAHRNRAHGVAGSSKAGVSGGQTPTRAGNRGAAGSRASSTSGVHSKRAASSRKAATTPVASGTRRRAARAQGAGSDRPGRTVAKSSSDDRGSSLNRDGLLRSLFPIGIPAREDAIRQVNAWLDEAERLARMR